jgi:NADH-quinone oxidoreductase subunit H
MMWFFGKIFIFLFIFIWLRGTLPRMRYDQFMKFGWKVLIPVSLVWIMIVAVAKELRSNQDIPTQSLLIAAAVLLVVGVGISYALEIKAKKKMEIEEARAELEANAEFDPFAGGFPVPPMPHQTAQPSRRVPVTLNASISSGEAQ